MFSSLRCTRKREVGDVAIPPARIFDVDLTKAACLQHKSLAGKEFGERLVYGKQ